MPRSSGPATAGTISTKPNGAPLNGPVQVDLSRQEQRVGASAPRRSRPSPPVREPAGQLGLAVARRPRTCPAPPRSPRRSTRRHIGPASPTRSRRESVTVRPGEGPDRCHGARERQCERRERAPACALVLPAVNVGANPPPHGAVIVTVGVGVASGPEPGAEYGWISLEPLNVPHVSPVIRAARGPPKKSSLKSLNGSCGLLVNVVVSCPVTGIGG